jgi:DNA-binding transcriptional regulator YdaS (Cro superfamily)
MRLSDYLNFNKLTHEKLAEILGTTAVSVTRWANGKRLPRPAHMAAIQRVTGGLVNPADFYRVEEQEDA